MIFEKKKIENFFGPKKSGKNRGRMGGRPPPLGGGVSVMNDEVSVILDFRFFCG